MIVDPIELEERKQTTLDLIFEEGVQIALIRNAWERNAAGGMVRTDPPTTLAPVRRFFSHIRSDPRVVSRTEGEHVLASYVLVGPAGDDIQDADEFHLGGRNFRIVDMNPDRTFETRAWVISYT